MRSEKEIRDRIDRVTKDLETAKTFLIKSHIVRSMNEIRILEWVLEESED